VLLERLARAPSVAPEVNLEMISASLDSQKQGRSLDVTRDTGPGLTKAGDQAAADERPAVYHDEQQ